MNLYYIDKQIEDCLDLIEFYSGSDRENDKLMLKRCNELLDTLFDQRQAFFEGDTDVGTSNLG